MSFLFGGGGMNLSIPFLFVKTIEKVVRMRTVLKNFCFVLFLKILTFLRQFSAGDDSKKN